MIFSYFLSLITFSTAKSLELNVSLVNDFLSEMKLSCGVVFHCENSIDIRKWSSINEFKFLSFYGMASRGMNDSNVEIFMKLNYQRLGIIVDVTCEETLELFEISSREKFFNGSYNWLLISDNYGVSIALLSHQNINFDAEITLAIVNDKNITLFDIYNPSFKHNVEIVITQKGMYNHVDGLIIILKDSKLSRRGNLQGIVLNAGVVSVGVKPNQTLEEYLDSFENPTVDAQHRHQYKLHKILSEKYNYSLLLHRAPTWGFERNGTYQGVLRMFKANEIELSITPFRVTNDRLDFVDFTLTTFVTLPEILFRHPKNSLRNPFLLPLSPLVWSMILVIMLTVTIFVTLTMKNDKTKNVTFVRAFMTSIGVMCQQGFMENFFKSSTRSVLLVFILFSTILYQYYSSFIVGSLLISPPKTINTLRQLIDSDLEVGMEEVVYSHDFLETTTDKLSLELSRKKIMKNPKAGNFFSVVDGIEKMHKGGFAFNVDTAYAYRIIADTFSDEEICEIHQIMLLTRRPLSMIFEKRSPFREMFKVEFLRFKEYGLLQYQDIKWQKKKPKCIKSFTTIQSVDLEKAYWVFMLLALSIIASFIVLILENVCFRLSKRISKRKRILQFFGFNVLKFKIRKK